jgi:hypothetical protein
MKKGVYRFILFVALCCNSPLVEAQSNTWNGSLDALVDWNDPCSLTLDKYKQFVDPLGKNQSDPIYSFSDYNKGLIEYRLVKTDNGLVRGKKTTLFGGQIQTLGISVIFDKDLARIIRFNVGRDGVPTSPELAFIKDSITKFSGDKEPRSFERRTAKGETLTPGMVWRNEKYSVELVSSAFTLVTIQARYPGDDARTRDAAPVKQLTANLDALLAFTSLWQWTSADLEKDYVLKLEDQQKQQKPPQFEWVSASKDRARFSRHMFSNAETNLTMFGGSIKVEEAILEFVNGKAARATISFYNRGDSGDIEVKEFDRILKQIGQNLGQVMKVTPKRQLISSNAALPVTGWNWTAPSGIALLEYNNYNTPGKVTKPEFLRLKLAAPNQADWSMGKMATGVQRMELLKRVKKTAEGDVYISAVPMVDQGQKGYCVAASCQRLFEYMRIPCDQHEMAKLVSIDAGSGADITTMQKSLAKIDGAFNVTFKPLVNPEQYYYNGKRRVSEKEFLSIIKEYTDKGVPLLWGLFLGQKPEDPPLPNGGQVSGGHMRMVIGYNLAKNQVLFTDSWGAGHELKRMTLLDAYDVTLGLYSMAPRGL